MLKNFNLHTIVRLPNGVFAPYTLIPTNLLFFDRSGPTREIWYYEHPLPEDRKNYTKTKPLRFEEFEPCITWWKKRDEDERAWKIRVEDVLKYDEQGTLTSANLDIKNPRAREEYEHMPSDKLIEEIAAKERKILTVLEEVKNSLSTTAHK